MKVKLVSHTASKIISEKGVSLTPEEIIVYTARVSNPDNQMNMETANKLLAYLVRNKHWSPFEMVDVTFEIVTSRGIAQQILRHRSFSFQEFSQRYAPVTDMEPTQMRLQAEKNRQSSTDEFKDEEILQEVQAHLENSDRLYNKLLSKGVAKECARFVLPITTQTTLYMKGSVRSWIHYLDIRCDHHTQLEHRQIANEIKLQMKSMFPNIFT